MVAAAGAARVWVSRVLELTKNFHAFAKDIQWAEAYEATLHIAAVAAQADLEGRADNAED